MIYGEHEQLHGTCHERIAGLRAEIERLREEITRMVIEVHRVKLENDGLRVDLMGDANWDYLCCVADRLTTLVGTPRGDSLPEQVEWALAKVAELKRLLYDYGWHKPGCAGECRAKCDCGWSAIQAKEEP